jgi:hypothetical protein
MGCAHDPIIARTTPDGEAPPSCRHVPDLSWTISFPLAACVAIVVAKRLQIAHRRRRHAPFASKLPSPRYTIRTKFEKGGVRRYPAVRQDFLAALKQDSERLCTTVLDYNGLPSDWPPQSPGHSAVSAPRRESVDKHEEAVRLFPSRRHRRRTRWAHPVIAKVQGPHVVGLEPAIRVAIGFLPRRRGLGAREGGSASTAAFPTSSMFSHSRLIT